MKIRSQIILAQLPTSIIFFFITIFFIIALTEIENKSESILVDNFKKILSMEKLNEAAEELNIYLIHHPNAKQHEIKKIQTKITKEVINLEKLSKMPEQEELAQELRKQWGAYEESIGSQPRSSQTEKKYKELKKTTTRIIQLNQYDIIQKRNNLINFITNYLLFISFFSIISLIFGFYLSWVFTDLFLSPLNKMIEIVSQFGKTDERTILHIKGSEEIEKLSNEFNLMTKRLEEFHQSSLGHVIENYENLKMAFDVFPDPLLFFSSKGDIIFMNKSSLRLFNISAKKKVKSPLIYIEDTLRAYLLNIVRKVLLTEKPYIPGKMEEPITIPKKKKKLFFFPFAYPIKALHPIEESKFIGVLIILEDISRHSLASVKTGEVLKTFLHDFQAPLTEIQMAIHTSLQEKAGPLTEKQQDVLYAAREKCEELRKLYLELRRISSIAHPQNDQDKQIS